MTPERLILAALTAAIAWLLYRDVAAEREYQTDREAWQGALREWGSA